MFCNGLVYPSERGLLIYVHKLFRVSIVDVPSLFNDCMFIMIRLGADNKLLIENVYGTPSSSMENDASLFNLLKYVAKQFSVPTLIVGDFNFRGIEWDSGDLSMKGLTVSEKNVY